MALDRFEQTGVLDVSGLGMLVTLDGGGLVSPGACTSRVKASQSTALRWSMIPHLRDPLQARRGILEKGARELGIVGVEYTHLPMSVRAREAMQWLSPFFNKRDGALVPALGWPGELVGPRRVEPKKWLSSFRKQWRLFEQRAATVTGVRPSDGRGVWRGRRGNPHP